ncbi:MAG: AraC family transcriptional regulator [Paenibacillus sp.]|nr:AraC family transcriptional regulator [Paenibacillus sp.]
MNSRPYDFQFYSRRPSLQSDYYNKGIELIYVHQGSGHVRFDSDVFLLNPGVFICYQPFQMRRLHIDSSGQTPFTRSAMLFDPSFLAPYVKPFPELERFFVHLWKHTLRTPLLHVPNESRSAVESFFQLYKHRAPHLDMRGEEKSILCIVHVLDLLYSFWDKKDIAKGKSRNLGYCERIIEWIEERYLSDFSLDDLANELHLSKHYTSHLFKKDTGGSIQDYVISRRIRQACSLLTTTAIPIEKIAEQLEMPGSSYFCRFFKKKVGMTPAQYRKQHNQLFVDDADNGFAVRTYGGTTIIEDR